MLDEKREHQRYSFISKITLVEATGVDYYSDSRNLSTGGVFLETDFPLQVGTKGVLTIDCFILKDGKRVKREIDVECNVKHVVTRESSLTAVPGMGIEFINPTTETVSAISDLIECLQPEE